MCGTKRRTLNNKAKKESQLRFYVNIAVPRLLYGTQCWILNKKEERLINISSQTISERYTKWVTALF